MSIRTALQAAALATGLLQVACGGPSEDPDAGGPRDGGGLDAGDPRDAGEGNDSGEERDGGAADAGPDDGGADAGTDGGVLDAGCTAPPSCVDGTLVSCVDGAPVSEACDLGCSPAGDACGAFDASNIDDALYATVTTDLVVTSARTLDTTSCSFAGAQIVAQAAGPELCVVAVRTARIAAGVTLRAIGSRPLVIAASGDIEILGILDAAATGAVPGAGGGIGGTWPVGAGGPSPGQGPDLLASGTPGGSGAGHSGVGGSGGGPGARSGGTLGDLAGRLIPLIGGSGGGPGAGSTTGSGLGGAGGGSIQLSAAGRLSITGGILVGGGGGGGGAVFSFAGRGGGGGGSGGAILLESPEITVGLAARLYASGGGGGGGGGSSGATQTPGGAGIDGRDQRLGGGSGGVAGTGATAGGPGGRGGGGTMAQGVSGTAAAVPTSSGPYAGGGGGGGAAGFIVARTADGTLASRGLHTPSTAEGFVVEPIGLR